MYSNVITAVFGASHTARTKSLHQWDYGQVLQFAGVNLPDAYTVHFSNQGVGGEAKTMVGNADGVTIPDEYLTTGQAVYAWVYLHTDAEDGETVYSVIIPVIARPQPTEDAPTPVQQGVIDQAIAALNAGVEAAQNAAESVQDMGVVAESLAAGSSATVDKSVDPETGAVTLSFGIPRGDRGEQGPQGERGIQGEVGPTGPAGPQGAQGIQGERGPQGIQGIQGPQGERGETGPVGPQGERGETGEQGPQGVQGETGPKGDTGATGPAGPQGPKGDPGEVTQAEFDDLKSQINVLGNGYIQLNVTEYIANKVLSSDGKSETANNNRWLSDFIPVTPGSTLYFYITAATERCAFYTAADYADVTGGTFTVAAGNPTAKVVPAGAAYIKIGWHKNNGIPNVVTIVPFIDDTAGDGALNKVWSANKSVQYATNVIESDKKIDNISRHVNFEDESGTFSYGFYNAVGGQWQANNSYGTITFPASYGDLFLVTGETLAVAGFALVLVFNESNEIIGRVYDGRDLSAKTRVRDMPLYISQQDAAWVALLGTYYYQASTVNYYPHAKRAITKYAHVRKMGVCFGDSTFGNVNPAEDIPTKLAARTGNTVLNGAFGGCRMSYYNGNYGAFSMYKLADAICTGVWTDQDAAMADPTFEPPAYAAQHLSNLKSTDFYKVDFVTIAYGTNDWRAGNALDDESNPTNTATIAGALRYSLQEIMTTYPQIDIYVLSPLWRVVKLDGETDENPTGYCDITPNGLPEADQYYLMDVCDTLKKVADEYHVTFINDFDLGINRYNWKNWLTDGTHPNKNGQDLMIGNIIKRIKNILV